MKLTLPDSVVSLLCMAEILFDSSSDTIVLFLKYVEQVLQNGIIGYQIIAKSLLALFS